MMKFLGSFAGLMVLIGCSLFGFCVGYNLSNKANKERVTFSEELAKTRTEQLKRLIRLEDTNFVVILKCELEGLKKYQELYYKTKGTFDIHDTVKIVCKSGNVGMPLPKKYKVGDTILFERDLNEIWDTLRSINKTIEKLNRYENIIIDTVSWDSTLSPMPQSVRIKFVGLTNSLHKEK